MAVSTKIILKTIPEDPGVYQFLSIDKSIIYVGKAKNLKKRVSSYFQKNIKSRKTLNLVKNTKYVEHVVVHSESDALLLENSLIKKNQPKYNILLRDDKTYPWICIKNEPFPRVFVTRKLVKDGSQYFGPFTSFKTINTIMGIIKQLYSLRNCNYNLSKKNIEEKKFKVCLEYHLGNCLGGCEGKENLEDYEKNVLAIRQILKGNVNESKRNFKKEMLKYSNNQEYEKAQKIKEKIQLLENYQSKSTVVSSKLNNIDVFSIISDSESAFVNFFQVAHGKIIRFHNQEIKKKLNEDDEKILSLMILSIREKYNSTSKNIISHINLKNQINLKFIIPRSGDNKKLLDLSIKNAKAFRFERNKQTQLVDPERHINRIMEQMRMDLKMKEEPRHIECFDISNIQGTNNVASCVVFKNGKPSKKLYRKFNIKTVNGQNDFGSMQEVVFRRYKRLLDEKQELPNLIVIDGGKGQLGSAVKSLKKLGLINKISILGIAKRLEELYFPNDSIPLYLNKKSETLKVIQQLRNEAHRFGVSFHRDKRSKSSLTSGLDSINGIGENTKNKLLKRFKSISKLKKADKKEIIDLIGKSKTEKVINYLKESV
ncbi:MAG: excinuclease ABC subunit C [Flavobacteriaceae bacterium]|nr:excinuclease ABC subunit C [Flavobacteriaceae bacterium]